MQGIDRLLSRSENAYHLVRRRSPFLHRVVRWMARRAARGYSRLRRFELDPDQPYNYGYLLGSNERGTRRAVKSRLTAGMTVVDVGAHVGYFSRFFARQVGRDGSVYAFEPDPDTFAILERNTGRYPQVKRFNCAVLDRDETVTIYKGRHRGTTSLWPENAERQSEMPFSVAATSLDKALDGVRVGLVKIDVEGAEQEVLAGMERILERSPSAVLIVECNRGRLTGRGSSVQSLYDRLTSLKLRVWEIDEESGTMSGPLSAERVERRASEVKLLNLWCER
jgi:FkbM family methyltransferase